MHITNKIKETIEIELNSSNISNIKKILPQYKNLDIGNIVSVNLDASFESIDDKSYRVCTELMPYLNKNEQYKVIEYLVNYKKLLCEARDNIVSMIVVFDLHIQNKKDG